MYCLFTEKLAELRKLIKECNLNKMMQELFGQYVMMEEYFMRESVVKVRPKIYLFLFCYLQTRFC